MTGLVSNVAYDIYCMTVTHTDLFEMALANVLETKITTTPSCCRDDFAADVVSTYELLSNYQRKIVTLSLGVNVPIYQEAHVEMTLVPIQFELSPNETMTIVSRRNLKNDTNFTLSDCLNGLNINPSLVVISSSQKTRTYYRDVFIGSLCPGKFSLNITAYEVDVEEVKTMLPISFPNGKVWEIATPGEGKVPPPLLRSAHYVLSGDIIELRFDSYTDMGSLGGHDFVCDELLAFEGAALANCRWSSSTRLHVTSGTSRLQVNDNVTLLDNVVASAYSALSFAPSAAVLIQSSISVLPVLEISAPAHTDNCSAFILDLTASTGSGGKSWQHVSIVVRSMAYNETNTTHAKFPADINGFYESMYDVNAATALPVGYLQPNARYFFDIKLCTAFNHCAQGTHKVEVANTSLPSVLIQGSHYKTMAASAVLRLSAYPVMSACDGVVLTSSEFRAVYSPTYTWHIFDLNGTVPILRVVKTNRYSSSLILQPYTLVGGGLYKVILVLSVSTPSGDQSSTAVCYVSVSKDNVRAITSPLGNAVVPFGETLKINASSSFDMNVAASNDGERASGHLLFNWTCLSLEVSTRTAAATDCGDIMFVGESRNILEVRSISSHVGAMYLLTLSLTNTFDDRFDEAYLEVMVESDCCTSLSIPVVGLVNSQFEFDLTGAVLTSLVGTATWSLIGSPSLRLEDITATPLTQAIFVFRVAAMSYFHLRFTPHAFEPGNSYSFMLEYTSSDKQDYRSATITLTVNDLPKPGIFLASPEVGVELKTEFTFFTSLWSDDQIPMSYYFAYYSEEGEEVVIKSKNAETSKVSMLLRGYAPSNMTAISVCEGNSSWCLPCFMTAYDSLGAYNSLEYGVTVNASVINTSDLTTLFETFLNDTATTDEVILEVAPIPDLDPGVECGLAPDCALLNRQACSSLEHTCGPCLPGNYLGESGHKNTFCFNNTVSEPGVQHCYDDSYCPSGSWTCDSYTCVHIAKVCTATCLRHGSCMFFNESTGNYSATCYVDDTSCTPVCSCHPGYAGAECDIGAAELELIVESVQEQSCGYADLIVAVDFDEADVDVVRWLTFMRSYFDEPFKISMKSANCLVLAMKYIAQMDPGHTQLSPLQADVMFNGIDTSLGIEQLYDYNASRPEVEQAGRASLLGNVSLMLASYCELITSDAYLSTLGQEPHEAQSARLLMAAAGLGGEGYAAPTRGLDGRQVTFSPASGGGRYCVVSYEVPVYSQRMQDLLYLDSFRFFFPSVVATDATRAAAPDGYFVIDVNPVVVIENVTLQYVFNISCDTEGFNFSAIECPDGQTYEYNCSEDIPSWQFVCPHASPPTCRRLADRNESTGEAGEEVCTVDILAENHISRNVTRIHCNCSVIFSEQFEISRVDVQFESMILFTLQDFWHTMSCVEAVSVANMQHSWRAMVALVFALCFLWFGVLFAEHLDDKSMNAESLQRRNKLELKKISRIDVEKDDFTSKFISLNQQLPPIFQNDAESFYHVFLEEIKRSHRWVSILFHYDATYPRHLRFLLLFSSVTCVVFFNFLLYSLINPDRTYCGDFYGQDNCLRAQSPFASQESICAWNRHAAAWNNATTIQMQQDGNATASSTSTSTASLQVECFFREPDNHGQVMVWIVVISALLSLPVIAVMELVITRVLCFPTLRTDQVAPSPPVRSSTKQEMKADQLQALSTDWLSRLPALPSWLQQHKVRVEENFDTRFLARDELIQLIFDLKRYRSTLSPEVCADFDTRWGFPLVEVEAFLDHMQRFYKKTLPDPAQLRASIDEEAPGGDDGEDEAAKPLYHTSDLIPDQYSLLPYHRHPLFYSRMFQKVWDNILNSNLRANEEIRFLQNRGFTDEERGNRLFELFSQDVLKDIVIRKSDTTKRRKCINKTVTPHEKMLGVVFVSSVNGVFFWYLFLFFLDKSRHHNSNWIYSVFLWLSIEVFLLSTGSVLYTHMLLPLFSYSSIQKLKKEIKSFVSFLKTSESVVAEDNIDMFGQSSMEKTSVESVPLRKTKGRFSLCPSLYISSRVAAKYPHLPESKLIGKFRSVVPNQPFYSQSDNTLLSYRIRFRFAALINSISVFFVYVIRSIIQMYPEFEFGIISVLSWCAVGFTNFRGGFFGMGVVIYVIGIVVIYMALISGGNSVLHHINKVVAKDKEEKRKKKESRRRIAPLPSETIDDKTATLKRKKKRTGTGSRRGQKVDVCLDTEFSDDGQQQPVALDITSPRSLLTSADDDEVDLDTPQVTANSKPRHLRAAQSYIFDSDDADDSSSSSSDFSDSDEDSAADTLEAFNRLRAKSLIPDPSEVDHADEEVISKGRALVAVERGVLRSERVARKRAARKRKELLMATAPPEDRVHHFQRVGQAQVAARNNDASSSDSDDADDISSSDFSDSDEDSAADTLEAFNRLRAKSLIPDPSQVDHADEEVVSKGRALVAVERGVVRSERVARKRAARKRKELLMATAAPEDRVHHFQRVGQAQVAGRNNDDSSADSDDADDISSSDFSDSDEDSAADTLEAFNRLRAKSLIPDPSEVDHADEEVISKGRALVAVERGVLQSERVARKRVARKRKELLMATAPPEDRVYHFHRVGQTEVAARNNDASSSDSDDADDISSSDFSDSDEDSAADTLEAFNRLRAKSLIPDPSQVDHADEEVISKGRALVAVERGVLRGERVARKRAARKRKELLMATAPPGDVSGEDSGSGDDVHHLDAQSAHISVLSFNDQDYLSSHRLVMGDVDNSNGDSDSSDAS
jgi:hypothetical protein